MIPQACEQLDHARVLQCPSKNEGADTRFAFMTGTVVNAHLFNVSVFKCVHVASQHDRINYTRLRPLKKNSVAKIIAN
jgi:hypothetical protein